MKTKQLTIDEDFGYDTVLYFDEDKSKEIPILELIVKRCTDYLFTKPGTPDIVIDNVRYRMRETELILNTEDFDGQVAKIFMSISSTQI